jgi:hypothetical protein
MMQQTDTGGPRAGEADPLAPGLFAIGGVGGSGTRAAAMLVRNCGAWIGDDLNPALDNLAFTLMFKRASVLIDPDARIAALFNLFAGRLQGRCLGPDVLDGLRSLTCQGRFSHSAEWLEERLQRLGQPVALSSGQARPGWKEPNTHVIIERLLRICPQLVYVHIVRDPFYLANSANQHQLRNWGPSFLDRPVEVSPGEALAYWVAVHRRLASLQDAYPGRILFSSYDRLTSDPVAEAGRLIGFLGLHAPEDPADLFRGVRVRSADGPAEGPAEMPDLRAAPTGAAPEDLEFCRGFMAGLGAG